MITRSDTDRRRRAAASLARIRPGIVEETRRLLSPGDALAFLARLDLWFVDIHPPLDTIYGKAAAGSEDPGEPGPVVDDLDADRFVDELVGELARIALQAAARRPAPLRDIDRLREIDRFWYQAPSMIGYVAYVDRFCGTLDGLPGRLDYLAELGVRYLHLMPLLAPRRGGQRRRLRGAGLPRGRPAAGHDGRPGASWPGSCAAAG